MKEYYYLISACEEFHSREEVFSFLQTAYPGLTYDSRFDVGPIKERTQEGVSLTCFGWAFKAQFPNDETAREGRYLMMEAISNSKRYISVGFALKEADILKVIKEIRGS